MAETARRALVGALVVGAVLVLALALWKLRLLLALLFTAFIVAAAMRPGVERLHRWRIPRGVGVGVHYAVLAGLVVAAVWLALPRALEQVDEAVGGLPAEQAEIREEARESSGVKRTILLGLQERLQEVPSVGELVDPLEVGVIGAEVAVAILFTLATAAYWIFERDRTVDLVVRLLPRPKRKVVRDTWDLIDLKLGAYVRGQLVLIALVGTVLSIIFWAIGLPYWLLVGMFAGIVEIVPVIGPLAAGAVAVGVGLTESVGLALAAGLAVLVVRLLEDYIVIPRVLGHAVGLSPLLVLVSVSATALLFGEMTVLLAIPLAAVLATLVQVVVMREDPAEAEVPTVIFPAKDAETVQG